MREGHDPPTERAAARKRRSNAEGRAVIVAAAIRTFSERGYHGASTRDVAAAAGMTVASLYHHFAGKQELLVVVMTQIIQDALSATRAALVRSGGEPAEQLAGLVRSWVEFHALRRIEARVGAAEIDSLEPEGRRVVVALRDEQEALFRAVVARGVEVGAFATPHPVQAARAILNMGTAVSTWYRDDGELSPAQVAEIYAELALGTVRAARG